MKRIIKLINKMEYEATKTCGRWMVYELYHDLNVLFPFPYEIYQLLTDKYMLDILIAVEKRKQQVRSQEYFVKEQKTDEKIKTE